MSHKVNRKGYTKMEELWMPLISSDINGAEDEIIYI